MNVILLCYKLSKLRWNGYIPRKTQTNKTDSKKKYIILNSTKKIELVILKFLVKKAKAQMVSLYPTKKSKEVRSNPFRMPLKK